MYMVPDMTDMTRLQSEFDKLGCVTVAQSSSDDHHHHEQSVDLKVDPENFRRIEELVKMTDFGRVEVLQMRMAGAATGPHTLPTKGDAPQMDDIHEEEIVAKSHKETFTKESLHTGPDNRLNRHKDELEHLLNEVVGIDLNEDKEFSDEEVPDGTLPGKKKSKKAKKKALPTPVEAGNNDKETSNVFESTTSSVVAPEVSKPVAQHIVKLSKKDKRLEKEEKLEKELQAKILQDRIMQQKRELSTQQADSLIMSESVAITSADDENNKESPAANSNPQKAQSCNTCGGAFFDSKSYRDHFRSEWHRFNLKRKQKNLPVISSEVEFLSLSVEQLLI